MDTKTIKELLNKYFAAETSQEEERMLSAYFNQSDIDSELAPYASVFRQFSAEKQVKAPANVTNKLMEMQRKEAQKGSRRIRYISLSIAAGLFIMLSIGIFRNYETKNDNAVFIMYNNGERIDDPVAALDFANKELEKISATFSKTNNLIKKPINTMGESLSPLKKTNQELNKVENLFKISK